jgi:hypothetical protein
LAETASGAKTQPEKAPVLVPQTAAKTQPEKAPALVQQTVAKKQPEKVPASVQQTAAKAQPEKTPALVQQTVAKMQPEKAPVSVQQAAVKTQPEKAPVSIQQTAATPASPQTVSAWQLLLLLRNSTQDDVRAHAANSLADHEKPTPAVVRALVSSAGADASSEVRLACLKTLLKLRVNDPTLPSTLMRLQTDQDSRVRDAAKALHEQLQSRADIPTPPRS